MHNIELYIFKLLFKILRPVRTKHKLSINLVLTLNSCYLYSKLVKHQFYVTDIYKFNEYYSIKLIKRYIGILAQRGFIYCINPDDLRRLHYITEEGISLIESIHSNYEIVFRDFVDKYNIVL